MISGMGRGIEHLAVLIIQVNTQFTGLCSIERQKYCDKHCVIAEARSQGWGVWVTWLQRLLGVKDEVKRPEGSLATCHAPDGAPTVQVKYILQRNTEQIMYKTAGMGRGQEMVSR